MNWESSTIHYVVYLPQYNIENSIKLAKFGKKGRDNICRDSNYFASFSFMHPHKLFLHRWTQVSGCSNEHKNEMERTMMVYRPEPSKKPPLLLKITTGKGCFKHRVNYVHPFGWDWSTVFRTKIGLFIAHQKRSHMMTHNQGCI